MLNTIQYFIYKKYAFEYDKRMKSFGKDVPDTILMHRDLIEYELDHLKGKMYIELIALVILLAGVLFYFY